jgi:hypothetical protein
MKKLTVISLVMVLLAIVLAVPASATAPTEVSGHYWMSAPPANRVWRPAGNNCIVEVDLNLGYTGDLVGTSTGHYRIVSHGPCEADGPVPYKHHETLKARGTFTGIVAGKSGSFDFTYEGKVWPAEPGELFLTARIVVLSGTGELANLHGWLEQAAVNGEAPTYSGQIHFD